MIKRQIVNTLGFVDQKANRKYYISNYITRRQNFYKFLTDEIENIILSTFLKYRSIKSRMKLFSEGNNSLLNLGSPLVFLIKIDYRCSVNYWYVLHIHLNRKSFFTQLGTTKYYFPLAYDLFLLINLIFENSFKFTEKWSR